MSSTPDVDLQDPDWHPNENSASRGDRMTLLSPRRHNIDPTKSKPTATQVFAEILERVRTSQAPGALPTARPEWHSVASYTAHLVRMLAPLFEISDEEAIEKA